MPDPVAWEGLLVNHALRAIGEGVSGNQFLRDLRESGAGVRRAVGLRAYAAARSIAAEYGQEPTRPLDRAPANAETRPWPTKASSGVLQTVQLVYREAVTGNLITRFYNVSSTEGVTRAEAVERAIGANADNARRYQQSLVGAFHTGTAVLTPQRAA